MKKYFSLVIVFILVFITATNVSAAIGDNIYDMNSATNIALSSSVRKTCLGTSYDFDYTAWFKFTAKESNYYEFTVTVSPQGGSGNYLEVKAYDSFHSLLKYSTGTTVTIGLPLEAGVTRYFFVSNSQRFNPFTLVASVVKNNHNISTSDFSVTLTNGEKYYYQDGNPICPNVKVIQKGKSTPLNGYNIQVSYTNNVNVGIGTVIVKGIGDYTGVVKKTFTIINHTHTWGNATVLISANCKESGKIKYTCSVCKTSKTEIIPKTNTHNFVEQIGNKNLKALANCKYPTIYYKICSVCGIIDYNSTFTSGVIDPSNHIYDNDCDSNCNLCGSTRVTEHIYNSEWNFNTNEHWHECIKCQKKDKISKHIYDNDEDLTCNVCGYERPPYTPGDLDGDEKITDKDAIYLLMHSYFPEDYPVNQPLDYNNDGLINDKDAIYLLMHCYFPEDYPITK